MCLHKNFCMPTFIKGMADVILTVYVTLHVPFFYIPKRSGFASMQNISTGIEIDVLGNSTCNWGLFLSGKTSKDTFATVIPLSTNGINGMTNHLMGIHILRRIRGSKSLLRRGSCGVLKLQIKNPYYIGLIW